jgi:hypothetical protein
MALASFRKLSQNPTKFTKKKKINVFLQNIYPPPSMSKLYILLVLTSCFTKSGLFLITILQFQALEVSSQALEFVPILTMSSFQEIVLMLLTKNVGHVDINSEPTLKPSFS